MKEPTLGNPQNTIEILQKYRFNFQKKFGQNFLIDTHVLDKIIRAADITKDDFVLEIGPGIGTMTQYLACAAREVTAVEIDKALIPILEDTLSDYDNVTVINEDILKVDIAALADQGGCESSILYYDTDYHGTVRKSCASGEYYSYGAEGSGRPNAGRTRYKGLWCFVACGSVLCRTVYCCKCTAELFYAETYCGICCDPTYQTCAAAGTRQR